MDYDDIDYDEGYSIRDIDNNWIKSNKDYDETYSDSDSDRDDYNYNSSTNNWSILIGDKIDRKTDRHNNSLLDMINKKLESLETAERSIINTRVERKSDSFLDLLERMKALNSKKEREFEPHHRSPLVQTMTDNWHNRQMDSLVSTDRLTNMTCRKNDERNVSMTFLPESKKDSCCIMQKKSEVEKDVCPIEIVRRET